MRRPGRASVPKFVEPAAQVLHERAPSGSDAPTASATPANSSTFSATRSWSTDSRSTATGDTAPNSPGSHSARQTGRTALRRAPTTPRTIGPAFPRLQTGSGHIVLVAARTADVHGRVILDIEWVPAAGAEARTAMGCFTRLAPLIEGAPGVIYDTALRGVHHQTLLRDLGLLPINRVTAAKANPKHPCRADRRVEKSARIEDRTITIQGRSMKITLYARGGAVGIGELTEAGDLPSPNWPACVRIAIATRTASTAGTTTINSPSGTRTSASPSGCTGTPRMRSGSSTAPRTSGPSRRSIPTSPVCTRAEMTPSRSTQPRRHPLDRTRAQRRPRPPAPQPSRLRAHGQRARAPPPPATPKPTRRVGTPRPPDSLGRSSARPETPRRVGQRDQQSETDLRNRSRTPRSAEPGRTAVFSTK
jgi:hypothetical protein